MELSTYLKEQSHHINQALDIHLPDTNTTPKELHKAMRYAVLGEGKRIRPILALTTCESLGGDATKLLMPALAIEILHAYTLIHDDLPCMDDDDLRRGKPATHIAFGEAMALLAGDALLTLAFEWASEAPSPFYVQELARAAGSQQLIGGQVVDMLSSSTDTALSTLTYIHKNKTAALIRCAMVFGAHAAKASSKDQEKIASVGENLGLLFQISDDMLDISADSTTLGKPAGSDEKNDKLTYPALVGEAKTRKYMETLEAEIITQLDPLPLATPYLMDITRFVTRRSK